MSKGVSVSERASERDRFSESVKERVCERESVSVCIFKLCVCVCLFVRVFFFSIFVVFYFFSCVCASVCLCGYFHAVWECVSMTVSK